MLLHGEPGGGQFEEDEANVVQASPSPRPSGWEAMREKAALTQRPIGQEHGQAKHRKAQEQGAASVGRQGEPGCGGPLLPPTTDVAAPAEQRRLAAQQDHGQRGAAAARRQRRVRASADTERGSRSWSSWCETRRQARIAGEPNSVMACRKATSAPANSAGMRQREW